MLSDDTLPKLVRDSIEHDLTMLGGKILNYQENVESKHFLEEVNFHCELLNCITGGFVSGDWKLFSYTLQGTVISYS